MMTKPKFIIGDELFVRNPTRYLKGCVSITGDVVEIESIGSSFKYWVMAEVVYPYPRQHWHGRIAIRSEEHTSELQSLMRISYAVFCFKKTKDKMIDNQKSTQNNDTHKQT